MRFPSLILIALLSATLATPTWARTRTPNRHCPVADPNEGLLSTHAWLHENESQDNDLWNSSILAQHQYNPTTIDKRQATNPLYIVSTYFHIVTDTASADPSSSNYVTDAMIAAQFSTIQVAYTNASIGYTYMGSTRTINATWASNGDDLSMKTALRNGTYSDLNVYFQSALQSAPNTPGVPAGSVLLGYCSLPTAGITTTTPRDEYVIDGCNVLSSTMPGGSFQEYNLGGSAVHEIGHWNGLLHPFQDNTCSAFNYGDYVADTSKCALFLS